MKTQWKHNIWTFIIDLLIIQISQHTEHMTQLSRSNLTLGHVNSWYCSLNLRRKYVNSQQHNLDSVRKSFIIIGKIFVTYLICQCSGQSVSCQSSVIQVPYSKLIYVKKSSKGLNLAKLYHILDILLYLRLNEPL